MPDDCIFCGIVAGKIPSARIYEDGAVVAFLDINPLAEGHALVVPRRHVERLVDLSADEAGALLRPVPEIAGALLAVTGAEGFNVLQNTGRCAGQVVEHLHLHVIPRRPGDGLGYRWPARAAEPGALERLQKEVQRHLAGGGR